jgi:predicted Zn finger-like uncharacterized protein
LNVTCPGCSATYFVDEKKVPAGGGRLTCRQCGLKWEIFRPVTSEVRAVSATEAPPAANAAEPLRKKNVTAYSPTTRKGRTGAASASDSVSCPKCGHAFVPETKAPPAPSRAGKRIILLVEDQKYFTEVTREALGSEYRTVSVATKDEALKVMATEVPSLLILDLSLARGQDGRDLLKAIPNKAFPILIFTARDETELYGDAWEELKKLGADDIVHKGMNVGDELRRKVALLLGPA